MATLGECEAAVGELADRLATLDPQVRQRFVVPRTVSCRVTDLGVVLRGRVDEEGLGEVQVAEDGSDAQVRLATTSDDLLELAAGRLTVPVAWATGRLRVDASLLDLLRLRALL